VLGCGPTTATWWPADIGLTSAEIASRIRATLSRIDATKEQVPHDTV
jgi:hypothetical protein